jgi:hypothetical protein
MITEVKVEVVEPDAPDRCQAVHGRGQCRYRRATDSQYCAMHGGNRAAATAQKAVIRQYQLAKWQSTVDSFADEDAVKSLRGEVGIARMLLEAVMHRCKDAGDLVLYSGKMTEQIKTIERLVISCHRLESNLGLLLDKPKVLALAGQIVEIIGRHVKDDDTIAAISQDIVGAIVATQGNTPG